MIGTISITSKTTGYVKVAGLFEDVFIDTPDLNTALDGDEVEIKGKKVSRIIKRAKESFVGTVHQKDSVWKFKPDDFKMYLEIEVGNPKLQGQKVLVRVTDWKNLKGKIENYLGQVGTNEAEMKSIVYEAGFQYGFSSDIENEARKIKKEIDQNEVGKRKDFRKTPTFTIDPIDAKDFDDAISLARLPDGNLEVGVHIADVSHFVREDSPLDQEALRRATSIYLVDRTVPMLPEALSNDLCSLKPNEDKLTFSAVFILSPSGKIVSEWFGKTIIHSQKRFTYEEAQAVLDKKEGQYFWELDTLNQLAYKLRRQKFAAGAISFESEEVRFELDERGKPLSVSKKERLDIHLLVEDFMLLANKRVAEFVAKKRAGRTFVYRNHDLPNIDRIANISSMIQSFGYSLPIKGGIIPSHALNDLLERVKDTPEQNLIETSVLRSMAKAVYSTKNIGHYGLAFPHYTHFTSPIRRYPDVMVHRLLDAYLSGKKVKDWKHYEKLCLHSSQMEQSAMEAERASIKYKQVEYMRERLGREYQGVINGVTKWGMYVETLDERCEGMIRLSDLTDDYYVLDEKNYRLIGQKTGKSYRLGDPIKIKVTAANLDRKTLDFVPA